MRKKIIFCAFLLFSQIFLSFGQIKVTFKTGKIPPPNGVALHLFLAGDFNNWNSGDNASELLQNSAGYYQILKVLHKGVYNFKITKGSWQTVECNAVGKAIDNRNITILHDTTIIMDVAGWQDNFKPEEKKHTASANVHIINEKFDIPQLGRQRRVWIYLPADYQSSNKKYPVIYMHDGQNLFDEYTSGYGEWGIDEIIDKLPMKDQCIIVGIDHGGEYRITEYDPYNSKYGKGRGDDYVDFLVKTLKPFVDLQYRTETDARHTTIVGSSMGGLISMYAALKYPGVFGNAGIFSPAFWIAPDLYNYAKQQMKNSHSRFYFVCGDAESESMVTDMEKMVAIIKANGISEKNTTELIIKGAKHNEKQWNSDFPEFYNWLIK
ncbi:MAG: phosphonate transporter ATP-binding protein [Mucilaginibacter sp.]|nr:phosphonate transporter ATP-binding protein [Mucilaginibacter sp.]